MVVQVLRKTHEAHFGCPLQTRRVISKAFQRIE
jgi:hypothetical protein